MTVQETTNQTEQPAAADSATGESLQEGGITPEVASALASIPAPLAEVLRGDIQSRNAHVEKVQREVAATRQAVQQDIQMAGVLRECMRDSEFSEFLAAKENGQLRKFYLQKAGVPETVEDPAKTESNQQNSVAPNENGVAPSGSNEIESLSQRMARIEREREDSAVEKQIAEFDEQYPDWHKYKEVMASVRQRNKTATLSDLYFQAKGMVDSGLAKPSGAAEQQELSNEPEPGGGTAQPSPPLPVGAPPGSSTPAASAPRSMAEAFKQAKDAHGIQGEVSVLYE